MLLIPCPYCGERDQSEFHYGGRAIQYPEISESADIQSWHQLLHQRKYSSDRIRELWYHQSGCECWFEVTRNLLSHEFEN